ncbi:MAG: hypothetical protein IJE25_07895 [Clostridia bacterium]|nr:hypothetical protein [Clostridia bacterium]
MESFNESAASVASPKTLANNSAITKSSEATASPEVASASDPLAQSSESYPEDNSSKVAESYPKDNSSKVAESYPEDASSQVAESYPEDASSKVAEDTAEQSSVGEASINGTNNDPTLNSADSEAELGGSVERESGAQGEAQQSAEGAFERDLGTLINEFPELRSAACGSINTSRYGELRALGLTVREAYLAAAAPHGRDNRAHIVSGVPTGARSPECGMSSAEMELARGIFSSLSEQEIKRLYAAVTK